MRKLISSLLIFCWGSIAIVWAQASDSVAFVSESDTLFIEEKIITGISAERTVGDQLQKSSGVFLRNSTLGGVQTISAQGLNAQHVQVLWNDIPVQSGMLGVTDLSLFSVGYKQEVQYAIQGQEWATGGIAGVVNIQNVQSREEGFTWGMVQSVGSFGQSLTKMFHEGSTGRQGWTITGGYERAKNDFPFLDYTIYPNKTKYLRNSQFRKWYVYPKWEMRINEKNSIYFFQEILSNYREVPPFMVTPNNLALQEDKVARQMLKWKYSSTNWQHTLQAFYSYSNLTFHDWVMSTSTKNVEQLSYLRYVSTWKFHPLFEWNYGSDVKNTLVSTPSYKDRLMEWGWDTYASLTYRPDERWMLKGIVKASVRSELGWNIPFLLEAHTFLGQSSQWKLWAKFGKDVRYPSLNDRYWEPGGRKDLHPEKSLNSSLGVNSRNILGQRVVWNQKLYTFVNKLDQLILWMPTNRGYAQPMNIGKVLAYGVVLEENLEWTKNHHLIQVLLSYGLNRSGNTEKRFQNDRTQWIQLPYFPIHSGKMSATYTWKTLKWMMDAQAYSKRMVTRDGDTLVPAYQLLNTSFSYLHSFGKLSLEAKISLNNLLNERYEEIRYRPMPGRNYLFTLSINWKHEKK